MGFLFATIYVRLFFRILLGLILISVGISKFVHHARFRQGIKDYQILPTWLESRFALSLLLSVCLPLAEIAASFALISGLLMVPAIILIMLLFVIFSTAIAINLFRGRRDLSCHCGGAIGNHQISWWLIARNGLFILFLLVLLGTPPNPFTVETLVGNPSPVNATLWMNVVLPVVVLVGIVLVVFLLFNAAQVLWRT